MKKIIRLYRRWLNRRLYQKLFILYYDKYIDPDGAGKAAAVAFQWITGKKWHDQFL